MNFVPGLIVGFLLALALGADHACGQTDDRIAPVAAAASAPPPAVNARRLTWREYCARHRCRPSRNVRARVDPTPPPAQVERRPELPVLLVQTRTYVATPLGILEDKFAAAAAGDGERREEAEAVGQDEYNEIDAMLDARERRSLRWLVAGGIPVAFALAIGLVVVGSAFRAERRRVVVGD